MKVNISAGYEKVNLNPCVYTIKHKMYEVEPYMISRRPTGPVREKGTRYYYTAHYIAFGDMINCHCDPCAGDKATANIIRKENPKFNPKKLNWDGNIAIIKEL